VRKARSLGAAVQIETHFSLGLPRVLADANQLELAILNLLMNARDVVLVLEKCRKPLAGENAVQ
jgi:signal transduction histidine kinase